MTAVLEYLVELALFVGCVWFVALCFFWLLDVLVG